MKRVDKEIWLNPQEQVSLDIWETFPEMFKYVNNNYSPPTINSNTIASVIRDYMYDREDLRIKNEH